MIGSASTGFMTGFVLILAIGAQNAFVLRQGLARRHVFWLCMLCATSDAILITAGIFGIGIIIEKVPMLPQFMGWCGATFLFVYGAMRFWAAYKGSYAIQIAGQSASLWATLSIGATFTWLNPHVYLDTLGLIGAISAQYDTIVDRYLFGIGAIMSSYVFFFGLGYGARLFAPVMRSARAWQILDILIGLVMWGLAIKLIS